MPLRVYNTLTNRMETFEPLEPGKVKMYACGVTVYDLCHLGHAMQAIIYDVIRNYFEACGYEVVYVRNHTDVDDKIIKRAEELGVSALAHSQRMIEEHDKDLALLGVKPATIAPKVSDHIPEIIAMIEQIIDHGQAYAADGDVYFRVAAFPEYGQLSNRSVEELEAGARIEVNPKKENPMDFALWKAAKEGEVSWPSPWGPGRPGWHIECSAMSVKHLGETFDIHGGGKDLIFPHHENEIAQSRAANKGCFSRYWIHNGLVTMNGQKMSKSLGNFITIKDAAKKWYWETIRFTILSHHYAASIDFSEKSFYDAYCRLMYFYNTLLKIDQLQKQFPDYPKSIPDNVQLPNLDSAYREAMEDDFNTAVVIREIGTAFKFLNDFMAAKKPKLKQKVHTLTTVADKVRKVSAVLGLLQEDPQTALNTIQTFLIKAKKINVSHIESLLNQREEARTNKDWARADEIRDRLIEEGVAVMDTPEGTQWQVQP